MRSKIEEDECTFDRKAKMREKFGGGDLKIGNVLEVLHNIKR